MKLFIAGLIFTGAVSAQSFTVTVSSQGNRVITEPTGSSPKSATLARLDICAEGDTDTNISTTRVAAAVMLAEGYSLYGSDVVDAVLAVLQDKDVFRRAQKAISAGSNAAILITRS